MERGKIVEAMKLRDPARGNRGPVVALGWLVARQSLKWVGRWRPRGRGALHDPFAKGREVINMRLGGKFDRIQGMGHRRSSDD